MDYAKIGVSNLFFSEVIKEKPLGSRPPLGKGRVKKARNRPSLAVEFEELLLQRHCLELIDKIHRVQRVLCYGCQYDRPGQLDHDVGLADWEDKVDHCFDTAYENVKLKPLFEDAKRELKGIS